MAGHSGVGTAARTLAEAHTPDPGAPAAPGAAPDLAELDDDAARDRQISADAAADLFGEATLARRGLSARSGRAGRPPGATNKRTDQLRNYIAARGFRQPAEFLLAIYNMRTDDLASALDCKRLEALGAQITAARELMPYTAQKMPTAIELPPADGRPVLILGSMETPTDPETGGALSMDDAIDAMFLPPEEPADGTSEAGGA